jgi:hypothetical protein
MGGGLMQLVAYGAQDIYLTGNPQITFFKVVYRRHTNFALESIEQTFNGDANFGKKVTCVVSRNGDLINRAYLKFTLPSVTLPQDALGDTQDQLGFRWLNWGGHALIKSVELEIGGQRIDKHYAAWLHIWHELTQTAGHAVGYANMVGNIPELTEISSVGPLSVGDVTVASKILYIPLQFFWNRNPGLALPLIALQYHEVKINLELEDLANMCWVGYKEAGSNTWSNADLSKVKFGSASAASLFIDYVYLDTDERRRFAQVSHEYLIEQLQFSGDESVSSRTNKIKLALNHPVKELIWVVQPEEHLALSDTGAVAGRQWFNFTDALDKSIVATGGDFSWAASPDLRTIFGGENPVESARLQLNGHDRFSERDGRYFNLVQPFQHHENIPSKGINVYSFALKPEEHQPSGTCNMSRIDNATLILNLTEAAVNRFTTSDSGVTTRNNRPAKIKVFAVNYNVLRIMSGMGGLAYSN